LNCGVLLGGISKIKPMTQRPKTCWVAVVRGHLAALLVFGALALALVAQFLLGSGQSVWQVNVAVWLALLVLLGCMAYAGASWVFARQSGLALERHNAVVQTLQEKIHQLEEEASRDQLTGVYSRFFGLSVLEARMEEATRHASALSLIFLDIDDFKRINDDYGHSAGDRVLKQIVTQITPRSADDVVCRFGGDEFLIICAMGTDQAGACTLAERLRAGVASYAFMVQPATAARATLTVSCGVTEFVPQKDSQQSLLERVSQALHSAKSVERYGARGRKNVVHAVGLK
jgi:diguanylate cyclase (GGDEF)-like protein